MSALEYLRKRGRRRCVCARKTPSKPSRLNSSDVVHLRQHGFDFLSSPMHVCVAESGQRGTCGEVVFHVCRRDLLHAAFDEVCEGIYVASPELSVAQLSSSLPFAKIVATGCELCGGYRVDPTTQKGFRKGRPLMSVDSMESFVRGMEAMRGVKAARQAVRYLVPGSDSPMETILYLLLCLPTCYGGYGLPSPEMNHRFNVSGRARIMTDKSHLRGDLCWPTARTVVEYDSDSCHTGSQKISSDAVRRNALSYMGLLVITVTRIQLMDPVGLDRVAVLLAQRLGIRLRIRKQDWRRTQAELRACLLDFRNG